MGSEMCIRDRLGPEPEEMRVVAVLPENVLTVGAAIVDMVVVPVFCLLYTSDAADERSSVDLGGRRIIKKKKTRVLVAGRRIVQT